MKELQAIKEKKVVENEIVVVTESPHHYDISPMQTSNEVPSVYNLLPEQNK